MEEPQPASDVPQVSFKKRSAKAKSNFRKRPATPPPASDSDDSGFTSSEDESGKRIKRRKTKGAVTATSNAIQRPAQAEAEDAPTSTKGGPTVLRPSDDATRTSHWHDVDPATAKHLLGNSRANNSDAATQQPDGTYKGAANYSNFIQKNPDRTNKTVGPIKESSNVRTITVTDFAPDVCKDYKQTGFCGFGDSCKFLHAREDYKQGWELDRDWEIGTKSGKKSTAGKVVASANRGSRIGEADGDDDDDALLESIPFACIICKEPYKNPVITKCGHYFCEGCALQRYRKKPDCAACGAGTGGVFNVAKKLKALLEKKRERARKRKEAARERGEDVASGSEDEG